MSVQHPPSGNPSRTISSTRPVPSNGVPHMFDFCGLPDLATLREVSLRGRGAVEREGIPSLITHLELILLSLITGTTTSSPCEKNQLITILQDKLAHSRSLLSPIRKLPTEILSEVFLYCQILEQPHAASEIDQAEIELSSTFYPALLIGKRGGILWKLTHICYQWRTLLLNTPSSWSTLRIISYTPSSVKQLALCLSRSGTLPLRFSLKDDSSTAAAYDFDPNMHRGFATSHKENIIPLLDLLYVHAHRWSKAFLAETNYSILTRNSNPQVIFNPSQPAPNWLDLPPSPTPPSSFPTSFPQLHTLGLCNTLDLRKLEMYHVLSLFTPTTAPALCHLILANFSKTCLLHEPCSPETRLPASLGVLPWTQLTSLTLLTTSPFASIMLVSKSSNITRLRVCTTAFCPFDGTSTAYPDVTLHKLEVFAIQGVDEQIKTYLEHLTAPSLKIFRLRCREYELRRDSVRLPETVSDFLQRSRFSGQGDIDFHCTDNQVVNSTVFGGL